ncbi:multicopper oxidase domain-containing protein [Flavilitoribacter nigricans]|nr:multicopper oxidase domain-containing protein [Flavilitoribacter nigricans]
MQKTPLRVPGSLMAIMLLIAGGIMAQPHFINPLPIPPLLEASEGTIELEMRETFHRFNPGMPADSLNGNANQPNGITTFSYNQKGSNAMSVLGPTLRWRTGDSIHIRVTNLLPQPTTTHWHGAEVPPEFDGGPHQAIPRNTTWDIKFENLDYASTLWYHPHYHNRTVQQVQMGLSGMILVENPEDPIRNVMPHTYGVDDIPVIIGDMGLKREPAAEGFTYRLDTLKGKRPFNLVNGVNSPYIEVPNALVRFRVLNGSTRKGIVFGFSPSYNGTDLMDFQLIGTDGGYVLEPNTQRALMNGPGSRDQVVVDLSGFEPGDTVYLRNLKERLPHYVVGSPQQAPPPGSGGRDSTFGNAFLQLRIVDAASFPDYTPITSFTPFITDWEPGLRDTTDIARYRYKRLVFIPGVNGGENMFNIDSTTYDMMMLNDTVCVDTKEIWTIDNTTHVAHPFHIHKIQFRILEIDSLGTKIDLVERGLNGPKDDVLVLPNWKLRFMGSFDDYPRPPIPQNGYMYHCHILTHEDSIGGGMMHQFAVADAEACLPVGVDEVILSPEEITLYPNPASGELYLRTQSTDPGTLRITDMQGRTLRTQVIPAVSGDVRVPVDGLPPGIFLAVWQTQKGIATRKILLY